MDTLQSRIFKLYKLTWDTLQSLIGYTIIFCWIHRNHNQKLTMILKGSALKLMSFFMLLVSILPIEYGLYNLNIRDCSVSIKRLLCIPCSIVTFPIKDCCVSYARLYHILYEIVPFPIRTEINVIFYAIGFNITHWVRCTEFRNLVYLCQFILTILWRSWNWCMHSESRYGKLGNLEFLSKYYSGYLELW
jgi:hypothetical protein